MIKVGYLVSYDYEMLLTSISKLYDHVDEIYLAIDENRQTWNGNKFELPDSFFSDIKTFDIKNKIKIYFDKFYISDLKPLDCETRERNLLSIKMGKGWLIQLDVDEYVYDFDEVIKYLKKYWYLTIFPKLTPIILRGKLVTLFKQIPEGFLYIENNERFPFITNIPIYDRARNNSAIYNHYTNINVIHQSWARSENEMKEKINNWGHTNDFDVNEYFVFWKNLSLSNHEKYINFHPISPKVWNKLYFLSAEGIEEFIDKYSKKNKQKLIKFKDVNFYKSIIYKFLKGS